MLKIFIIILIVIFIVVLAVGIIDGNRFEVVNEEFELPIIFVLIDGIPKHVPITTVQPNTPLIKGIITLFPKPDLVFFVLSYDVEPVTGIALNF